MNMKAFSFKLWRQFQAFLPCKVLFVFCLLLNTKYFFSMAHLSSPLILEFNDVSYKTINSVKKTICLVPNTGLIERRISLLGLAALTKKHNRNADVFMVISLLRRKRHWWPRWTTKFLFKNYINYRKKINNLQLFVNKFQKVSPRVKNRYFLFGKIAVYSTV